MAALYSAGWTRSQIHPTAQAARPPQLRVFQDSYTLTDDAADGDTVDMFTIPAGWKILYLDIEHEDLGVGTITFEVGTSTSAAAFISAYAGGGSAGSVSWADTMTATEGTPNADFRGLSLTTLASDTIIRVTLTSAGTSWTAGQSFTVTALCCRAAEPV